MKSYASRRAYVTMSVLMLMALVSVVLLTMAAVFATQARRTVAARDEAQLRQLVQAGTLAARQYLVQAAGPGSVPPRVPAAVALPRALVDRHGVLTVQFVDDTHARIVASLERQQLVETVTFELPNRVAAAELSRPAATRPAAVAR